MLDQSVPGRTLTSSRLSHLLEVTCIPLYSVTKIMPYYLHFPRCLPGCFSSPPPHLSWGCTAACRCPVITAPWGGRSPVQGGEGAAPRDELDRPCCCLLPFPPPTLCATQGYCHPVVLEKGNKLKRFIKICLFVSYCWMPTRSKNNHNEKVKHQWGWHFTLLFCSPGNPSYQISFRNAPFLP